MRIGIVTEKLAANYGGILQNWALQHVLKEMGHEPITIDYMEMTSYPMYVLSIIKTIFLFFIPSKRRRFHHYVKRETRKPLFDEFVQNNIIITLPCKRYTLRVLHENGIEALIVGSDQVWRPMYNKKLLPDMYLKFAKDFNGPKLSYAASFGVDNWEYSETQTKLCKKLIKRFTAVSVREESGCNLCKSFLDINATAVLDPTLLVSKEEYQKLCKHIPVDTSKYIGAYILNHNEQTDSIISEISKSLQIDNVKVFSADNASVLSIPEWIALFRDTEYVITDSFHGTVFSIIFEKQFRCIYNPTRGSSRFDDLLSKYEKNDWANWKEKSKAFLTKYLV